MMWKVIYYTFGKKNHPVFKFKININVYPIELIN